GGGLLFALVSGTLGHGGGYGWLSRSVDGSLVGPILLGAGVLIGYGSKTAGGCTSGNGLSGTALGSPASFVAFASFMATAVGVSLVIEAIL
ncbi:MAG: sulfur transport, partial [Solirubrobacteraceae bacterium]|nr:sulfur transport [Solirubrobacteraceae bacterium]